MSDAGLAIHTMTTRPLDLERACAAYVAHGVGGVTVWREHLEPYGADRAARIVRDHGLGVPALCRGGFFCGDDAARAASLDDNRRALDEAAALGADQVVLVCGAVPGLPLATARGQIADGIAAVLPHAEALGVRLAIEPLHPMYAADRSAIATLGQARAVWERLDHPLVGVAVDVYHVWWDDALADEIARAGAAGRLFGFHLCDWRVETRHLLLDRGLMGEGCIDLRGIRALMEEAGFAGWYEVEIFSERWWETDQDAFVGKIVEAYREHC